MESPFPEVDPDRSWLAVLVPFTASTPLLAEGPTPSDWTEVPVPVKDLVPAAAVLINGGPDGAGAYRWLQAPNPGPACTQIDDTDVMCAAPQVFTSRSGAGVVVLPARPAGPSATTAAAWVHLARRAGRVGRPVVHHDAESTKGVSVAAAGGTVTTLREHLIEILTSAGITDAVLDDRGLVYSALFARSNDRVMNGEPDVVGDDLARHLLRHVELDDAVRTDPSVDDEAVIRPQVGTRLFASLRSAGMVGVDLPSNDRYYSETMPQEFRSQYLLALLLVMVQRTALLDLSARTAAAWHGSAGERLRRLDGLRREQVALAAGGVYTQVMESTSQDRWHQLLVRTYRLVEYQAEVMQNLASLHDSVVAEASQRLDRRVTAFGVLIGIPSLVFGFFGLSISRVTSPGGISVGAAIAIVAAATGLGVVAWLALAARFRRR